MYKMCDQTKYYDDVEINDMIICCEYIQTPSTTDFGISRTTVPQDNGV